MMTENRVQKYRDSFQIIESMLENIIENDSMNIAQMAQVCNLRWQDALRYVQKLMKGKLIDTTINHGRSDRSTATHYGVTIRGKEILMILKEMNQ